MTRIIKNVEIAKAVADELNMNFAEVLDEIDIEREPEQEEIPVEESIVETYIEGFRASIEE